MLLGVEHIVLDAPLFQKIAEALGIFYGNSTYQHRLSCGMSFGNSVCDGFELILFLGEDSIVQVFSDNRLICRNNHYVHVVDIAEFLFLGLSCTCHARKLLIHSEIVLKSDGCESLGL